jgi:hypothetical protein
VFQKDRTLKSTVKPWDLLNPETEYVDDDVYQNRLSVCRSCEHFFKPTTQCKKCGCFMKIKTAMKDASCPVKKW